VVEAVGGAVVGEIEIHRSVAVVVEARDAHRVAEPADVEAGFAGGLAERPIAVVQVEGVGTFRQTARSVHDVDLVAPAPGAAGGEDLVPGGFDVVADEEIVVAVAVGVEERRADAPARVTDAGPAGHLLEGAVAPVPVEEVGAEGGHVDVGKAVAVDVADAAAVAVDGRRHAGGARHVAKGAVALVAIEDAVGGGAPAELGESEGVHEVEVLVAVAVVVEGQNAVAGRFQNVALVLASRIGDDGEAGGGRPVDELERGAWRGAAGRSGEEGDGGELNGERLHHPGILFPAGAFAV
jgi:hypothetical protein